MLPVNTDQRAYLVTLNLDVVARNLSAQYRKPFTRLNAQSWLTTGCAPFAETKTFGIVYCESDPANLLEDGEFSGTVQCPMRKSRPESKAGKIGMRSPYLRNHVATSIERDDFPDAGKMIDADENRHALHHPPRHSGRDARC